MFVVTSHHAWRRELIIWHGAVKPDKWSHVLLTWNRKDGPRGSFTLYHNGIWKAVETYDRQAGDPATLLVGSPDENRADVSIDELVVYHRVLTESQALFLRNSFAEKGARFQGFTAKLAEDDHVLAERRALVSKLEGKVGILRHFRNNPRVDIELPEGIVAAAILPQDVGKADLSKFGVIFFPQGPRYQVEPEQHKHLVDYVKNGGGYVGSCQGAYFGSKLGLLNYECHMLHVWGIFKITLSPHVVNDWRKDVIDMHFGNGPVMVPGEGCNVAGTYVMTLPGQKTPAAIVTGQCGKGRVVAFGAHPLGGYVSRRGTRAFWTGKLLETERMLVNALLYAAGLTDNKNP